LKKAAFLLLLAACAANEFEGDEAPMAPTPTVDYVERMDPYGGSKDPFLAQLAMNYRSYAIYNADVSGFPEIAELFAQKSVSAFSGETPMPETLDNWKIQDHDQNWALTNACRDLIDALKNDAAIDKPKLAAEAQAKFDCWLSAEASGQLETAAECRKRFEASMLAFGGNGGIIEKNGEMTDSDPGMMPDSGFENPSEYPNTAELRMLSNTGRMREGVVIVNNVNVPRDLIRPAPVHPVVFNQNIYSNGRVSEGGESGELGIETVSRDEFINMMMALRAEIKEIEKRLAEQPSESATTLKVQQIPTEPKQRIMEEIFEVHFDFNKSAIKPEYQTVIQKLAQAARGNNNVKISVVGHTDTVGSDSYNYSLGGKRAEAVKQMLIAQGIPAGSIIVVSSGKNDLKVPTGKNVKKPENRRVRVVKEVGYLEPQEPAEEYLIETK
jgi:outer membrane protein OmpA-like peptidoglycan-associated protein